MSDRSGVGAPTHDGAESDPGGSEEPAERANGARRPAGTSARAESTAGKVKRRIAVDLFGVRDDADDAAPPPGVPVARGDAAAASPDTTRRTSEPAAGEPGRETAAAGEPGRETVDEQGPDGEGPHRQEPAEAAAATDAGSTDSDPASGLATTIAPDPAPPREAAASGLDRVDAVPVVSPGPPLVSPEAEPESARGPVRGRGPLRARRVHRIVRRVDPWSVLKLSLFFFFCVWVMVMISGVLVWGAAVGSGTVENLETFIANLLAFEEFRFNADQIFRLFAMGGLIMVFMATATAAILAVLFNLISDLIGGIRVTVIEEETTRRIVRRS